MIARHASVSLLPAQQSALAKIACAVVRPGAVALLCGPHGTGKTTLLTMLAADERLRDRSVDRRDFDVWDAATAPGAEPPDIVLVDDAHLAPDGGLARLVVRCLRRPQCQNQSRHPAPLGSHARTRPPPVACRRGAAAG